MSNLPQALESQLRRHTILLECSVQVGRAGAVLGGVPYTLHERVAALARHMALHHVLAREVCGRGLGFSVRTA